MVRNIVDASSMRDILEASVIENYQIPKLYVKMHYCIEAAIHQRIVRVVVPQLTEESEHHHKDSEERRKTKINNNKYLF